jgi:hypothetical protein
VTHTGCHPVCDECLFFRTPNRAPYRTPSACAKRATYLDPPPVVPDPESIAAQAAHFWRSQGILSLRTPGADLNLPAGQAAQLFPSRPV